MKIKNELTIEQVLSDFNWLNEEQTPMWRGKKVATWKNNRGYMYVTIYYKGFKKNYRLHRLIALKYIPNPDQERKYVDHIDGNQDNNRIENLRWCSQSENLKAYYANRDKPGKKLKRKEIKTNGNTTTITTFDGYVYYNCTYTPVYTARTMKEMADYLGKSATTIKEYISQPSAGADFLIKPEFSTTSTNKITN